MRHSVDVVKDGISIVSNDLTAADSTTNPGADDGGCFNAVLLNGTGLTRIGSHLLFCNGRQPFGAVFIGERRLYKSNRKTRFVRFGGFCLQNGLN